MARRRKKSRKTEGEEGDGTEAVEAPTAAVAAPAEAAPAAKSKKGKKSKGKKKKGKSRQGGDGLDDDGTTADVEGGDAPITTSTDDVEPTKRKAKRKRGDDDAGGDAENGGGDGDDDIEDVVDDGTMPPPPKIQRRHHGIGSKYINKQRVLVFGSRGLTTRHRHLLLDLRKLLPHSKKDVKMDRKDKLYVINEIAEMKSCNNVIFFEARKRSDLYMWFAKVPQGPSAKFLITNVHTMSELKMTGNCLKGSRPVLSFDATFDTTPHWKLLRELLQQMFNTPNRHPKSKPFVDHVMSFTVIDDHVWFRNYQIVRDLSQPNNNHAAKLVEIGPRFVMQLIRIFDGSFCGATLYENPEYKTPNATRSALKFKKAARYRDRVDQRVQQVARDAANPPAPDIFDDVFLN